MQTETLDLDIGSRISDRIINCKEEGLSQEMQAASNVLEGAPEVWPLINLDARDLIYRGRRVVCPNLIKSLFLAVEYLQGGANVAVSR